MWGSSSHLSWGRLLQVTEPNLPSWYKYFEVLAFSWNINSGSKRRFFISTSWKFTTHFQTGSSSRIHQSKAMLWRYYAFSGKPRQRYLPGCPPQSPSLGKNNLLQVRGTNWAEPSRTEACKRGCWRAGRGKERSLPTQKSKKKTIFNQLLPTQVCRVPQNTFKSFAQGSGGVTVPGGI